MKKGTLFGKSCVVSHESSKVLPINRLLCLSEAFSSQNLDETLYQFEERYSSSRVSCFLFALQALVIFHSIFSLQFYFCKSV